MKEASLEEKSLIKKRSLIKKKNSKFIIEWEFLFFFDLNLSPVWRRHFRTSPKALVISWTSIFKVFQLPRTPEKPLLIENKNSEQIESSTLSWSR